MTKSYNPVRIQQICSSLSRLDTQELRTIWKKNNRREWSPEAFEAIRLLLLERLGTLPDQYVRDPREELEPRSTRRAFYLISFEGEIEFPGLSKRDANHILAHVRTDLASFPGIRIERSGKYLSFQSSWSHFSWKHLPADGGEIEVLPGTPGVLKFKFDLVRSLILWVFVIAILGIEIFRSYTTIMTILGTILFFGFILGIYYLYVTSWLNDFVWQAIHN